MQNVKHHIDPDRFAAFDHDAPTTDELAHLAGCTLCRAERQAYVSLQSLASAMVTSPAPDAPRLTEWDRLATALRQEGLLTSPPVRAMEPTAVINAFMPSTPTRRTTPVWLRVAAAMVLTVGGALFGRLSTGTPLLSTGALSYRSPLTTASQTSAGVEGFSSVQQASDVLYRAQRDYERASLWLAANDTTIHDSGVYRARLAALDQMMAASRAALRDAPQDPVLNHYFLAAYTAREATLQALGGALPVDKSLERY